MVKCSSCGKPIDKIPVWLTNAKVEYVCDNCPNRHYKNIAFVELAPVVKPEDDDEETVDIKEDDED